MTPAQIDTVTNGLINLHTFVSDWWPAITGLAITTFGTWLAFRCARFLGQHELHRGIQRLEHYANHPGARRLNDDTHNQPREEDIP